MMCEDSLHNFKSLNKMNKNLITALFYVKLGLSRKTVAEKFAQGNGVCTSMSGNLNFPVVVNPTILELQTATTALFNAYNAWSLNDGTTERAAMINCEATYDLLVTQMALYVQQIADNNPSDSQSIIDSAGMETRKTPGMLPLPTQVTVVPNFTNIAGNIKVLIKGGQYASWFEVWITSTPTIVGSWVVATLTKKRSFMLSGLVSDTRYSIKVVPHGTAGEGPASQVVNQLAA